MAVMLINKQLINWIIAFLTQTNITSEGEARSRMLIKYCLSYPPLTPSLLFHSLFPSLELIESIGTRQVGGGTTQGAR